MTQNLDPISYVGSLITVLINSDTDGPHMGNAWVFNGIPIINQHIIPISYPHHASFQKTV